MTNTQFKLIALAALGFSAPLWWTMIVNNLINGFYVLGGSPEHPSRIFAWSSILLPSIVLGLLTGFIVLLGSRARPLLGWIVFFVFLAVGLLFYAIYLGSAKPFTSTFGSPGNLAFFVATILAPLWENLQSRNRANNGFQGTSAPTNRCP